MSIEGAKIGPWTLRKVGGLYEWTDENRACYVAATRMELSLCEEIKRLAEERDGAARAFNDAFSVGNRMEAKIERLEEAGRDMAKRLRAVFNGDWAAIGIEELDRWDEIVGKGK